MNIYFLLGGMTLFVSTVLYSVISRTFCAPETLPRRRRASRRLRTRWYEVWYNAAAALIVKYLLFVRGIICAAFATLHTWITKSFRASDDLQESRRSAVDPNRCEHCEAQPLSGSCTPTRSLGPTQASRRARGPRAPPSTPVFSFESSRRMPTTSLNLTRVSPRARRSQAHPPSPSSSSGDDTLIGTPSRAPSVAPENDTTQATQATPRPRRLHKLEDFIASASVPPFQGETAEAAAEAFHRLTTYMSTNLHISPGTSRLAAFLSLIYGLHFAIAPERSLPLSNPEQNRYISSREIACVFLNRYGSIVWPTEPEPAPHLTDRMLQFPRDATINEERHEEWRALLLKPPARGSAGDLAMSLLGERMTAFVRMVYKLPLEVFDDPDWDAAAFVLDDTRIGQQDERIDSAGLSEALRRSIRTNSL